MIQFKQKETFRNYPNSLIKMKDPIKESIFRKSGRDGGRGFTKTTPKDSAKPLIHGIIQ